MTVYETIRVEREGAVAHLQLNRPERINALGKAMLQEIHAALDEPGVECSPGTSLLHDVGYANKYPDLPFIADVRHALRNAPRRADPA